MVGLSGGVIAGEWLCVAREGEGRNGIEGKLSLSLPPRNSKDQQNLFAVAAACLISIAEYIKMRVDAGNIDQTSISRSLLMLRPDRGRRGQKKGLDRIVRPRSRVRPRVAAMGL